jgi:hypothetical protein
MKTFLIFDFGNDEDAAQKARHRLEGWKQGFRLGDKLTLKFERESGEEEKPEPTTEETHPKAAGKKEHGESGAKKGKKAKKAESDDTAAPAEGAKAPAEDSKRAADNAKAAATESAKVRVAVGLNFSSHEKMSYHRWLERIPAEEPFKGVAHEVVRESDANFEKTAEWFQSLDSGSTTVRTPH